MQTHKARRMPATTPGAEPGGTSAWEKGPAPPPKPLAWYHRLALSGRERALGELVPTRLSCKEIGRALAITESTVKTNMRRILPKTGTPNRDAPIAALYAAGYAPPADKPGSSPR